MPGGKHPNFSEAVALRAFSLHCRLSIHLQHQVSLALLHDDVEPLGKAGPVTDLSSSCWTVLLRREGLPVHFGRHWVLVRKQSSVFYPRSRRRISQASQGRLSADHPGQKPYNMEPFSYPSVCFHILCFKAVTLDVVSLFCGVVSVQHPESVLSQHIHHLILTEFYSLHVIGFH